MDRLDKVLWINCKHREDRRKQMEEELKTKFQYTKAERYEAILNPILGELGCVFSHANCLRRMLKEGWQSLMILEDDATLQTSRENLDRYIHAFLDDPHAQMMNVGNNPIVDRVVPYSPLLLRALRTQTTSCVVLKPPFARAWLRSMFHSDDDALHLPEEKADGKNTSICCDTAWWPLMQTYLSVVPVERRILIQRPSYSDIQHNFVSFGV